jgi:hypothetical protein
VSASCRAWCWPRASSRSDRPGSLIPAQLRTRAAMSVFAAAGIYGAEPTRAMPCQQVPKVMRGGLCRPPAEVRVERSQEKQSCRNRVTFGTASDDTEARSVLVHEAQQPQNHFSPLTLPRLGQVLVRLPGAIAGAVRLLERPSPETQAELGY